MTRLFGFAQLEFAGTLAVADGRYVVRDEGEELVLVLETLGSPPPPRRRRRRPRGVEASPPPAALPLTRAMIVRASEPFAEQATANAWLEDAIGSDDSLDELLGEGIDVLNRALHAQGVASGDPRLQILAQHHVVTARLGYGSGEEVAAGEFTEAREVDARTGVSRKQQRDEELRPQQRLAAVLGGRERFDACETLILRAQADLDAGRNREAALQLRVGLEALLAEFSNPPADPGHEEDMTALKGRRHEAGELANAALEGDLSPTQLQSLRALLAISVRVLRRRRVLSG